ncbi:coenzyme A pyrophosphatase [Streptomyces badius]
MADDRRWESTGVPMTHTHAHSTTQARNSPAAEPGHGPAAGPGHGPVSRVPDTAVTLSTDGLPAWLDPVADAARSVRPQQLSRFLPPESGAGRSPPS